MPSILILVCFLSLEEHSRLIIHSRPSLRASSELSRLEGVEATWRLWETQAEELRRALRKDCDTLKVLDAAIQTGSLTDTATASMQDVERLLNDRRKSQPGKRLTLQHTRTQVRRQPRDTRPRRLTWPFGNLLCCGSSKGLEEGARPYSLMVLTPTLFAFVAVCVEEGWGGGRSNAN